MRILFGLSASIDSNSGGHVDGFARQLALTGDEVTVAAAQTSTLAGRYDETYRLLSLDSALCGPAPEILHVWTPRELMCQFVRRARTSWGGLPAIIVHLEDDDRYLTEALTGRSWKELAEDEEFDPAVAGDVLCRPQNTDALLASADGVTCIVDALHNTLPPGTEAITLWPGVDVKRFMTTQPTVEERDRFGIPRNTTVLSYTGAVHAANGAEVRSLYVAVGLLNRRGHPAVLVRTGVDYFEFLEDSSWTTPFVIPLGTVAHNQLPAVLALADILVQPGRPGPWNDCRLPSKIPEFLAAGRPVVLPNTNIGRELSNGEDAHVVPVADGIAIANAVAQITADPDLGTRLAAGGRSFAEKRLHWPDQAATLRSFYETTLLRRERQGTRVPLS